jgi:hypothetical protein
VAKRGLFRRIVDRVFGTPKPERPIPTPPPPPTPPGGGGGTVQPPSGRKDDFWVLWNAVVSKGRQREISRRSGYSLREVEQQHLIVFLSLPGMAEEDRAMQLQFWEEYCQEFVMGRGGKPGRIHFLHDVGLDARDFSWDEWRRAMDYKVRG